MTILHRYLLRELFGATFGGVALFAFVLITGTAIKDIIRRLVDGVFSLSVAVELIGLLVPFVLTYALPMGMLTAVLLVLGRISAQNEITAMRTAGLGLTRIAAPILLLAVGGVALCLVINFTFAPRAKTQYRQLLADAGRTNPLNLIVPRQFIRDFPDLVIYVGARDGNNLTDVWVWKTDREHRVEQFARGATGSVDWNEEAGKISVNLQDAHGYMPGGSVEFPEARGLQMSFESAQVFKRAPFVRKVSWMDFGELVNEHRRLAGAKTQAERDRLLDVEMNIHEKAAMGFSVLSLVMVGIPLGIRTRRVETSANLGLALLLAMAYYFVMIAITWLDRQPQLHPQLLQWVPNLAFQALGGWMWWRLGKN